MKYIIALAILVKLISCNPKVAPIWPQTFKQTFTETMTYGPLKSTTTGTFYYDANTERYRVDRKDGKYDRYCGSVYKFVSTPCQHFVSEGKRYLNFPEKNDCCYCCDAQHGCGILKPDWLTGASFVGYENAPTGESLEKWNQPGLQPNYAYFTNDNNRIMQRINQSPDDDQVFDVSSFTTSFDQSSLDLPKNCDASKTCPWLSICTSLRG